MVQLAASFRQRGSGAGWGLGLGKTLIVGVGNYLIVLLCVQVPGAGRGAGCAPGGGRLGLPAFPAQGAAEVSGVKAGPQGRRVSDAEQP
jgi:hypothetical protein